MFQTGYIIGPRADAIWYLALPAAALGFALACQQWLSAVAMSSVFLLINGPHNFVTLFRAWGLRDDRQRFAGRLIVGAVACTLIALTGLVWAPLSVLLLATVWNYQHQLMQIHGFGRIYDFKGRTGSATTANWDFWLHVVLYVNLIITLPLYTQFWLRELYRFDLPVSAAGVRMIHQGSWMVTGLFLLAYAGHVIRSIRQGFPINPIKYAFIGSTYAVLYITGWHTASVLVHTIASQLIHGIQYIVIVYFYMQRKVTETGQKGWLARLVSPGYALPFVVMLLTYAVAVQLISNRAISELGFGFLNLMSARYTEIPEHGMGDMSTRSSVEVLAILVVNVPGILHLYYDSFIWKVREKKTHGGL